MLWVWETILDFSYRWLAAREGEHGRLKSPCGSLFIDRTSCLIGPKHHIVIAVCNLRVEILAVEMLFTLLWDMRKTCSSQLVSNSVTANDITRAMWPEH